VTARGGPKALVSGAGPVSGGPLPEAPENAVRTFLDRVARSGGQVALRTFPEGRTLTWREWAGRSRAFAARLMGEGVEPGDRVAIWGGNRPLWPIADLGALMAGAVPVGIYPSSAPAQVRSLLDDAGAVVAVGDRDEWVQVLQEAGSEVPGVRLVLEEGEVDPGAAPGGDGAAGVAGGGEGISRESPGGTLPGESAAPDDDAILIYTSGSTGEPRGARISHRCLMASAASIRACLELREGDVTLSFLPFCHAAERIFGLYTRILTGIETVLVDDHRRVWEAARATRPTLFGGLPRFYEKVHEALRAEEARGGDPRARISEFFGDRLRVVTSGGATLPSEVSRYLADVGVPVLGAYGLTEHLCAAMNRPGRHDLETSGPPMPGTELRIAADGEILIRRGPLTFSGYLNRGKETAAAFTADGEWLLTGDLGEVDAGGFLRVTGRKKDLLALSTGKKVAPAPLEARLVQDPWISQAVVVGEGRKFVSALLVLSRDVVGAWAREEGISGSWEELRDHPRVRSHVDAVVAGVNREVSRTESIRRYAILDRELTRETGELTPTLKVRRPVVLERHGERVDELYREDADGR
jgi:long-chain acyl-CoA synthetase